MILWKEDNEGLHAKFEFENQTQLALFLVDVATKADEIDHHPDAKISKCKILELTWISHWKNVVTPQDRKMSEWCTTLYQKFMEK